MTDRQTYTIPQGQLSLAGPVVPPEKGVLPVRGDLAHIALAGTHFVAHYAMPTPMSVGEASSALLCNPQDDSEAVVALEPGDRVEILDMTSEWAWGCCGPDGPAGYIRRSDLSA